MRRWRGRFAAWSFGALAVCAACTSFDAKDAQPSAPDATVESAAPVVPDSSPPISPPEDASPPVDSTSPIDATDLDVADAHALDAMPDATLDAGLACPDGGRICDDFERSSTFGFWNGIEGNGPPDASSTIAIDTMFATSGTRSLKCVPFLGTSAALFLRLEAPKRIDVSFSMRTDVDPKAITYVMTADFTPTHGFAHVLLRDGALLTVEQQRFTDAAPEYYVEEAAGPAPEGAFTRFTFSVDTVAKTITLRNHTNPFPFTRPLVRSHGPLSMLHIGVAFNGKTGSPHWLDDIVVVTTP